MKRTLLQRIAGRIRPETIIREEDGLRFTSRGRVILTLPNAHSGWREGEDSRSRRLPDGSTEVTFDDGFEGLARQVRKNNDASILNELVSDNLIGTPWDTGLRYAATLTSGKVLLRVPEGDAEIEAAAGPGAERVNGRGAIVAHREVLALLPEDFDARNDADILRAQRELAWEKERRTAVRSVGITTDGPDALLMRADASARNARKLLKLVGATETSPGTFRIERDRLLDSGVSVQNLMAASSKDKDEQRAARHRAERAEKARRLAALAARGIDARNDPAWVHRDEKDGKAFFTIPKRATGLIEMLLASGAEMRMSSGGDATAMFTDEKFKGVLPLIAMIGDEISAVRKGAHGGQDAMRARVEEAARAASRQATKSAIAEAKRRRTRGSVPVSASASADGLLDPLNPLNPVGIFQMSLWAQEGARCGAEEAAKAAGARLSDGDGGFCVEPSRGDSWSTSSNSSYGSSHDSYSSSSYSDSSSSCDSSPSSSSYE